MQGTSFVVLTGHLNDYPLSGLIGMLRRQRKTGRLLVEYPAAPCSFYFENGDLVDAQLSTLTGLQAVYVALSQPNASFNFNPLIQPPRRSIDGSEQKTLLESLGCWEEKVIKIKSGERDDSSLIETVPVAPEPHEAGMHELPMAKEMLALPPASAAARRRAILKREVFTASAILLLLLTLFSVIALAGWLTKREAAIAPSSRVKTSGSAVSPDATANSQARTIEVVVLIENGRVSQAFISNPRPGMEDYEALALRIARQRRFPTEAKGRETVAVLINAPLE